MELPKVLLVTARILGVLPLYWKKKYLCKASSYSLMFIATVIITAGYAHQMYGRINGRYKSEVTTTIITESLALYLLTITNFIITYKMFALRKEYLDFVRTLYKLRKMIEVYVKVTQQKHVLILYVFMIMLATTDTAVQLISYTADEFQYYLVENVLRVRFTTIILLLYCFVFEVYDCAKGINNIMLVLTNDSAFEENDSINDPNDAQRILVTVNDVRIFYSVLLETVKTINTIFGDSFFAIYIYLVAIFLIAFNVPLTWAHPYFVRRYIIWGVMYMMFGVAGAVILANICYKTTAEGRRTASLAYSLLQRDETFPTNETDNLRRSVILLVHQATKRHPVFIAGGFFTLDHSTLYTFMNLLTGYVIVLIQFKGAFSTNQT